MSNHFRASRVIFVAFLLVLIGCTSAHAQSGPAVLEEVAVYPTLIVFNGKIATMDSRLAEYQAMAVRGDRIWKLGTNDAIKRLAGPTTQVIDLKGRTVVPGLVDVHTHPQLWGWWHFGGQINPLLEPTFIRGKDVEEVKADLRKKVEAQIKEKGKDTWIIAAIPLRVRGQVEVYSQSAQFEPGANPLAKPGALRRADLDAIAPDTPLVMAGGCCTSLANSKGREVMMKELGYDPTGDVRIPYDLVWGVILKGKIKEAAELAAREMRDFVKYGVTTVGTHGEVNTEFFRAINMLEREGRMPQRLAWSHETGFYGTRDAAQFYRLLGNIVGQGSDFLWNYGVGWEVWNSESDCMSAKPKKGPVVPYDKCIPSEGRSYQAHLAAAQSGLRLVDLHVNTGDVILDRAFALADDVIKSGAADLQEIRRQGWFLDHNTWVRPDQIPLVKKYGFWLNFRAARLGENLFTTRQDYGQEYSSWVQPVRRLLDAGIPFNLTTDIAISSFTEDVENSFNSLSGPFPFRDSVWPYIGTWVQRETEIAVGAVGSPERRIVKIALDPEQRIDRVSALKAMTIWGAQALLRGDRIGSLEPGKLADFVVTDRDYFTIPEEDIMKLRTIMTVLGGQIAYKDDAF